jgi:flagellar protein FliL
MKEPIMSDTEKQPKKKGGMKKILIIFVLLLVVGGGGIGAGLYASGNLGGAAGDPNMPKLVVRDGIDSARASEAMVKARTGRPDPRVFQPTYYPVQGNFTSNLRGGDSFVQIGIGVSTFYDQRVTDRLQAHDMAVRSAIILTLSEQDPVEISTVQGKEALKESLKNAINGVLTNREGFGGIEDVYFTSFVTQ